MKPRILALLAISALLAGGIAVGPVGAMTRSHAGMTTLHVTLQQQAFSGVTGTATVTYDPASKKTTVKVTVNHLEPGSSHPAHIHAGKCTSNGPVLEPLTTIKADKNGTGVSTTTFSGSVMNKAAHINVHMGPGLALTEYTVLACGELGKA